MRQAQLPTQVMLLTASLPDEDLLEAVRLRVGGIIPYELMAPQLVSCIRKVAAGGLWLACDTVGGAVELLLWCEVAARERAQGLTPREREVGPPAAMNLPPRASAADNQVGV